MLDDGRARPHPGRCAGAAPIPPLPATRDPAAGPAPVVVQRGGAADPAPVYRPRLVARLRREGHRPARAPRIWIDHGTTDEWAGRATALKDRLRARGILPEYSETTGEHHGTYWQQNASRYLDFYSAALAAHRAP